MAFVRMSPKQLRERIAAWIRDQVVSEEYNLLTVVIDGKAAAGKSYMGRDIKRDLKRRGVPVCRIEGDWFLKSRDDREKIREKECREIGGHMYVPEELHLAYWEWDRLREALKKVQEKARAGGGDLSLNKLYNRKTGECDGSETVSVKRHGVMMVEGCYLLAKMYEVPADLSILLYVNREIGRFRKIGREEAKQEGEFPNGERVGTVITTWEQLEEPTFFRHLIEHGHKADVVADTSDTDSFAVMKLSLGKYGERVLRRARKWDDDVEYAEKTGNPAELLRLVRRVRKRKLALTDEDFFRAISTAGRLYQEQLRFGKALGAFSRALKVAPNDLSTLTRQALMFERLGKMKRATGALKIAARLLKKGNASNELTAAEVEGIRGRVYKQLWVNKWRNAPNRSKMQRDAGKNKNLLLKSLRTYKAMFQKDPASYYNGDNAAALSSLYKHLTGKAPRSLGDKIKHSDLVPATRVSAAAALRRKADDFWALTTLGNLAIMEGNRKEAGRIFKRAVSRCSPKPFEVDSVMQQLRLFRDLGFRTAACRKALAVLRPYLKR